MGYYSYFTRKRARFKALSSDVVNIPYGTKVTGDGKNLLFFDDKSLTYLHSKNSIDFFVQNDDGYGEKRAELVNTITSALEKLDANHQKRWNRVWEDDICKPYRRKDHKDFWLWDRSFYDAPIFILEHIKGLVTKED